MGVRPAKAAIALEITPGAREEPQKCSPEPPRVHRREPRARARSTPGTFGGTTGGPRDHFEGSSLSPATLTGALPALAGGLRGRRARSRGHRRPTVVTSMTIGSPGSRAWGTQGGGNRLDHDGVHHPERHRGEVLGALGAANAPAPCPRRSWRHQVATYAGHVAGERWGSTSPAVMRQWRRRTLRAPDRQRRKAFLAREALALLPGTR
jgi:hypothetical protein